MTAGPAAPEGERVVAEDPAAPAATTTTLRADASRIEYGEDLVLRFAVASSTGVPAGSVTVRDAEDRALGTVELVDGEGTLRLERPDPGTRTLTARFAPASQHQPSTSAPLEVQVDRASTLSRLRTSSPRAGRVALVVRVLTTPDAGTPTGRVRVLVDGELVDGFRLRRRDDGRRRVVQRTGEGRFQVQVLYRGDALHAPSRSRARTTTAR